jgi:hypothetical protein
MELGVVLPAYGRHATHQVQELTANLGRRADRYEQAMHEPSVSRNGAGPRPVFLEQGANISDIGRGSTGP